MMQPLSLKLLLLYIELFGVTDGVRISVVQIYCSAFSITIDVLWGNF